MSAKLKFLHPPTSLNRVKLEAFRQFSTDAIVNSLKPPEPGCLKTRPDGTVLDSHRRLFVLSQRGENIGELEREIIEKVVDES